MKKTDMHHLPGNVKHLRTIRKLSQQELAELLGLGRTTVANIELGLANPGYKTLLELVKIFDVSADALLHSDLRKGGEPARKAGENTGYRPLVVTVDEAGEDNIALVDTRAAAGYPTRSVEPEYYRELPAFKLPGSDYRNGTFRCFQVEGDSMTDTLQTGDYVIARFCDNHFRDVREGYIHVVVTGDNVLVKRLINRAETEHCLILISDNNAYPEVRVDIDDIREIWYVKSKLSTYMPVKKHDLEKIIGDLTMQVELLKKRLDEVERN